MNVLSLPWIASFIEGSLELKKYTEGYDVIIEGGDIKFDINRPCSNFYTKPVSIKGESFYLVYDEKVPVLLDLNFKEAEINGVSRNSLFNSIYLDGHFIEVFYGLRRRDPNYIRSFVDVRKSEVAEIEDHFYDYLVDVNSLIIRKNIPLTISKLDSRLGINWKREFPDKSNHGSVKSDLIPFKNKIITNLGCTDGAQESDGYVIALDKETGDTCWLAEFKHPILSCAVIDDCVYLTAEANWYVLSADDGSIQLQGDASENIDNINTFTTLSTDGKFLYFVSVFSHATAIYDRKSGEFLGKIDAPEGFIFSFDHPTIVDGYLYFELGASRSAHKGNVYGLLITTTEEIKKGAPFNIKADNYDYIAVNVKDDGQGQYYEVSINDDTVGNILHYGRIAVQKLIGENTFSNVSLCDSQHQKGVNELFNGRVDIRIPKTKQTEKYTDKFDLICEKIKQTTNDCITPFDKRALNVSWTWQ